MPPLWISEKSADDLMREALDHLIKHGTRITPSKGAAIDSWGACLVLTNPLARLSRTEARGRLFSCLGELLWYLSRSNRTDFIEYYVSKYREFDEGGLIHGGYGPRLFDFGGIDQVAYVIDKLRASPDSRQAVIQVFDRTDVTTQHLDTPCTCVLQFLVRDEKLQMVTFMRSNDAYLGLPHDLFAFTMLQELVARSLAIPMGFYTHSVGSLHLYERDRSAALAFLDEGWQSTGRDMPDMPLGDPWEGVSEVLTVESALRSGAEPLDLRLPEEPYWADLSRLLVIFALAKRRRAGDVAVVRSKMASECYDVLIGDRVERS